MYLVKTSKHMCYVNDKDLSELIVKIEKIYSELFIGDTEFGRVGRINQIEERLKDLETNSLNADEAAKVRVIMSVLYSWHIVILVVVALVSAIYGVIKVVQQFVG